jgi:hypothetical protein
MAGEVSFDDSIHRMLTPNALNSKAEKSGGCSPRTITLAGAVYRFNLGAPHAKHDELRRTHSINTFEIDRHESH